MDLVEKELVTIRYSVNLLLLLLSLLLYFLSIQFVILSHSFCIRNPSGAMIVAFGDSVQTIGQALESSTPFSEGAPGIRHSLIQQSIALL